MKARTIRAVKKGAFPPARAYNTFKAACYALLKEERYAHEEVVDKLIAKGFGDFTACSVAGVEHYRSMLNVELAVAKKPLVKRLVIIDGRIMDFARVNPAPKPKSVAKKSVTVSKRRQK